LFGGDSGFVEDLRGGVVGEDGHGRLGDDRAGVRFGGHLVQRRAGFRFAVQHSPVGRHAAAILGQQRAVHVVGAARGEREQVDRQHVAVVERENEVRRAALTAACSSALFGSAGVMTVGMP
jgi:hypothetical protein